MKEIKIEMGDEPHRSLRQAIEHLKSKRRSFHCCSLKSWNLKEEKKRFSTVVEKNKQNKNKYQNNISPSLIGKSVHL